MGESEITSALREAVPGLVAAYRFGSQVTGMASAQSDVDIAVLADQALEPRARWELQERLAARVGRDVDLVDLRRANAVMRAQVITGGVLLLDLAPFARALFEACALSDYARLNEERRGILEDVRARGTIHG